MKKTATTLSLLCLVLHLGMVKLAAQTNLLSTYNPGFESALTDWGGSGLANVSIDNANPGEGAQSAKHAASPGNTWNTLVNTVGTIATVPGRNYQLSALARQTLVGGTASLGFCELNSSKVATHYLWKAVSNSASWHSESLTLVPRSDTAYVRIYLIVDQYASSGAVWWDGLRVTEVSGTSMATVATSPFGDDTTAAVDVAPLPVTTFTKSGTTITPGAIVPVVKYGSLLVGGTLSWKVVTEAAGASGPAIVGDSASITEPGIWGCAIDINKAAASFNPGNYLVVLSATSRDQTISRVVSKPITIQ